MGTTTSCDTPLLRAVACNGGGSEKGTEGTKLVISLIEELLNRGAHVNAVGSDGISGLWRECWAEEPREKVIEVLLDWGADPRVGAAGGGNGPRKGQKDQKEGDVSGIVSSNDEIVSVNEMIRKRLEELEEGEKVGGLFKV